MPPSPTTYHALVGDRRFEITLGESAVLVDGEPVACTFERLAEGRYVLLVEGRSLPVVIEQEDGATVRVTLDGQTTTVRLKDERALLLERFGLDAADAEAAREIRAPMPGLVLRVLVEPGQEVEAGDGLLVLEAMKMENELRAPSAGTVAAVHATPGAAVAKNELLISFE